MDDSTLSPSATAAPNPAVRWICVGLGVLLIISPFIQAYLAIEPNLVMLQFVSFWEYFEAMLPLIFLGNATLLAGACLLIGGIGLAFGKPWGYVLAVGGCGFMIVSMIETVVTFLYILSTNEDQTRAVLVEMAYHRIGMFSIFFVFLVIGTLVYLNVRSVRNYLQVRKLHTWVAIGIGLVLLLDLHFCLWYAFNAGGFE